jgi:hypothetical protein
VLRKTYVLLKLDVNVHNAETDITFDGLYIPLTETLRLLAYPSVMVILSVSVRTGLNCKIRVSVSPTVRVHELVWENKSETENTKVLANVLDTVNNLDEANRPVDECLLVEDM